MERKICLVTHLVAQKSNKALKLLKRALPCQIPKHLRHAVKYLYFKPSAF